MKLQRLIGPPIKMNNDRCNNHPDAIPVRGFTKEKDCPNLLGSSLSKCTNQPGTIRPTNSTLASTFTCTSCGKPRRSHEVNIFFYQKIYPRF